jgi:hypothetical protein
MSRGLEGEGAVSGCLSVRMYGSFELFARFGGVKLLCKEKPVVTPLQ